MRLKNTGVLLTAFAVSVVCCSAAQAQSGTKGVVQGTILSPPSMESVVGASPTIAAPMPIANQVMPSNMGTSVVGQSVMGTSPGMQTYNPMPSQSYSPMTINPTPQGCGRCDLTPVPTVVPCLKPVTSCCGGNLGPYGVPSVFTPLRNDMPPIGRAVGRPLIGRWSGF